MTPTIKRLRVVIVLALAPSAIATSVNAQGGDPSTCNYEAGRFCRAQAYPNDDYGDYYQCFYELYHNCIGDNGPYKLSTVENALRKPIREKKQSYRISLGSKAISEAAHN